MTKLDLIQVTQSLGHLLLSCVGAISIPDDFWWNFTASENNTGELVGVSILYASALCYHLLMYFRDPTSGTVLRSRHPVVVAMSTVLVVYQNFLFAGVIITANYFLDIWDFVKYTLLTLDRKLIANVCIIKVHHILTVVLIGLSWIGNYTGTGAVVMFINDVTDVPMFALRIMRRNSAPMILQAFLAVIVVTTWVFYRVFYMAYVICENLSVTLIRNDISHQISLGFLFVLFIFNVYWTFLVVSKVCREAISYIQ
jgi:hypothetical protein